MIEQTRLSHRPIRPPRQSRTAEHVYVAHWIAAMSVEPDDDGPAPLARILRKVTEAPNQRHASVAASFICWLGTALGLGWRQEADRYAAALKIPTDWAYLAAWAVSNRRDNGCSGVRLIEHMLAPVEYFGTDLGHAQLLRDPDLSAEDHEVVDAVARWLGTDPGQVFLRECEAEVREIQDVASWAQRGGRKG